MSDNTVRYKLYSQRLLSIVETVMSLCGELRLLDSNDVYLDAFNCNVSRDASICSRDTDLFTYFPLYRQFVSVRFRN